MVQPKLKGQSAQIFDDDSADSDAESEADEPQVGTAGAACAGGTAGTAGAVGVVQMWGAMGARHMVGSNSNPSPNPSSNPKPNPNPNPNPNQVAPPLAEQETNLYAKSFATHAHRNPPEAALLPRMLATPMLAPCTASFMPLRPTPSFEVKL